MNDNAKDIAAAAALKRKQQQEKQKQQNQQQQNQQQQQQQHRPSNSSTVSIEDAISLVAKSVASVLQQNQITIQPHLTLILQDVSSGRFSTLRPDERLRKLITVAQQVNFTLKRINNNSNSTAADDPDSGRLFVQLTRSVPTVHPLSQRTATLRDQIAPFVATVTPTYRADALVEGACAMPLVLPRRLRWDAAAQQVVAANDANTSGLASAPVDDSLYVVDSTAALLRNLKRPVAVLCVAGPSRSGKSFILNDVLGRADAFELGHTGNAKTMGIWLWSHPFKSTAMRPDGTQLDVDVLLLDTEGIEHLNAAARHDNSIFVLSMLLSSLFVFNQLGTPKAEHFERLELVANLTQSISVREGVQNASDELKRVLPAFVWLVRDAVLDTTGARSMRDEFVALHAAAMARDSNSTGARAFTMLFTDFPSFHAYGLPPPSEEDEVMHNLDNPAYRDRISKTFLQEATVFKSQLLRWLQPKCAVDRSGQLQATVSGAQLEALLRAYVDALSQGAIPDVGTAWQRALTHSLSVARDAGTAAFAAHVATAAQQRQPCLEADEVRAVHEAAVHAAELAFECQTTKGISDTVLRPELVSFRASLGVLAADAMSAEPADSVADRFARQNAQLSREYCDVALEQTLDTEMLRVTQRVFQADQPVLTEPQFSAELDQVRRACEHAARGPARATCMAALVVRLERDAQMLHDALVQRRQQADNIAKGQSQADAALAEQLATAQAAMQAQTDQALKRFAERQSALLARTKQLAAERAAI